MELVSSHQTYLWLDWLKCCFTSTETIGLLGTGAQDVHLNFHTAPELWVVRLLLFFFLYVVWFLLKLFCGVFIFILGLSL